MGQQGSQQDGHCSQAEDQREQVPFGPCLLMPAAACLQWIAACPVAEQEPPRRTPQVGLWALGVLKGSDQGLQRVTCSSFSVVMAGGVPVEWRGCEAALCVSSKVSTTSPGAGPVHW